MIRQGNASPFCHDLLLCGVVDAKSKSISLGCHRWNVCHPVGVVMCRRRLVLLRCVGWINEHPVLSLVDGIGRVTGSYNCSGSL